MRNLKITISYDGTESCGWQIQPGRASIQGEIAAAVERVCGERVLPQGSGRTDAGVHALAQVASFAIAAPVPLDNFRFALNNTLPATIRIMHVEEAAADFHARKSAAAKTYRYRISRAQITSPFLARYVWHYPYPLDEAAMAAAASAIIGEHDFTSFAAADPEKGSHERSRVRTVFSSAWRREGDELIYEISGAGFLHHMVRNLVGSFILVGKGTISRARLIEILSARDRSLAGPTAPPQGLALVSVKYSETV
ncbi:MAG: tRNA pseudouridine(38-40) synthase TruA [Acidobacteriaceae bacterium]